MPAQNTPKNCLSCGKALHGRADKKFCNDYCRNYHNNQLKINSGNYVRSVNNVLLKNRRVLEKLLPETEGMIKVPRDKMLHAGFQFTYMTHTYTNKKGNIYYFCYDYGYLPLENSWYLLVRRKDPQL
ncbi:hypothetical protein [Foetidibacter luteolus]|uniref:hypothetical protein n=1 Tax=Foetidibacter luteolus TaxID=2608880 RepID=UPI00129A9DC9|nr:hypothetical protein [Foetidibacter luteolus]